MPALSASITTKSKGSHAASVPTRSTNDAKESFAGPIIWLTFFHASVLALISCPYSTTNGSNSSERTRPFSGSASAIVRAATPQKEPISRTRVAPEEIHKDRSFSQRSGLADQNASARICVDPSEKSAPQSVLFTTLRNSSTGSRDKGAAHRTVECSFGNAANGLAPILFAEARFLACKKPAASDTSMPLTDEADFRNARISL
mmetsp:Transcript_68074/g.106411  ORF Transcript_68074/g.106411 Transcript_68074/m.106411 type:complete len:203 (-) Transcript_68074:73-681(-)